MNKRKAAIYAWRNGISKQNHPFKAVWGRKLTTKERAMMQMNPWDIFKPRGCRIWYAKTPNAD